MFTIIFLLFYSLFTLLAGIGVFAYSDPFVAITWLMIWQILNITLTYDLTRVLLASLRSPKPLAACDTLEYFPPVAILYLTRDDLIPAFAQRLLQQTYPNSQIFVLDDSELQESRRAVDRLGMTVIRRDNRRCWKAGNLNNWFARYKDRFKYAVVMDNDILVADDFVVRLVAYAEHPANEPVGIFQSQIFFWNTGDRFANTINTANHFEYFLDERVDNDYALVLPVTAFLIRMDVLQKIGGFVCSLTEDHATGLVMITKGYRCKRVNVIAYQSTSTNVQAYTQRMRRWAMGKLPLIFKNTRQLPVSTVISLVYTLCFYVFNPLLRTAGLLLIAYLTLRMSAGETLQFLEWSLEYNKLWRSPHFLIPVLMYSFYFGYSLVIRPLLVRLQGTPLRQHYRFLLLHVSISLYAAFTLLHDQVSYLIGSPRRSFSAVIDQEKPLTFWQIVDGMSLTAFVLMLVAFSYLTNPILFLIHLPWILPALLSPWILVHFQGTNSGEIHSQLLPDISLSTWVGSRLCEVNPDEKQ